MTLMKSGDHLLRFSAARFVPGRGRQDARLAGFHRGQPSQDVGEVFANVDFEATAVFYDGVEDGAFAAGLAVSYEQPVFLTELGRTDGVFYQVVVDLDPTVGEVAFEILPLVEGIGDGFAEFGARQDAADTEFDDGFVKAAVNHPAFRCANCFAQGGACFGFTKPFFDLIEKGDLMEYPGDELRGLVLSFKKFPPHVGLAANELEPAAFFGSRAVYLITVALDDGGELFNFFVAEIRKVFWIFCKKCIDSLGVTPFVPVEEDTTARYVRCPEVAGLGFSGAGLEVSDRCFVKLSVWTSPMFVLDFSVNDIKPVGTEQSPVAKGLAVEVYSHGVEHFNLPIVGKMKNEAVVNDFRDESRAGDATLLQAGWQRGDDGRGDGIVDTDILAADHLLAEKFGTLEVQLLADFFAHAAEGFGIELDLRRDDLFSLDGKMFRDAWGAGLGDFLAILGKLYKRSGCGGCFAGGDGGGEVEKLLAGIELFARCAKNSANERINVLAKDEDFSCLTRDDFIALGDLIE